ncbi:MAG: hypothetical protein HY753_05705 [Nitrospirae bacterium]|nr:hypothetical protein [Nitrospirota bacterium]
MHKKKLIGDIDELKKEMQATEPTNRYKYEFWVFEYLKLLKSEGKIIDFRMEQTVDLQRYECGTIDVDYCLWYYEGITAQNKKLATMGFIKFCEDKDQNGIPDDPKIAKEKDSCERYGVPVLFMPVKDVSTSNILHTYFSEDEKELIDDLVLRMRRSSIQFQIPD